MTEVIQEWRLNYWNHAHANQTLIEVEDENSHPLQTILQLIQFY